MEHGCWQVLLIAKLLVWNFRPTVHYFLASNIYYYNLTLRVMYYYHTKINSSLLSRARQLHFCLSFLISTPVALSSRLLIQKE